MLKLPFVADATVVLAEVRPSGSTFETMLSFLFSLDIFDIWLLSTCACNDSILAAAHVVHGAHLSSVCRYASS